MNYRSEIDGLRALAVVPVMLFHAGFTTFGGGFVGVDVFFVISGYLITQIILNDLVRGTFSIARFYERRARRILPALFCVMLVTIPFAYLWMSPSQHLDFSRSLMAVVAFVSNIFFWRESGYFAAAAGEKPLLHTWSLGVEEQFYVFFPVILLILWRFGKATAFKVVVCIAVISLGLCEYASRYYSSANFFLLPTRAWELMVGALCAFTHLHAAPKKQDIFALLGLASILAAIFVFDEHMRLPSIYMALPVLGTALILLYGTNDTIVGRLLSLRPVVGIGLISYSTYLWHQPIFAFARIQNFTSLSDITMGALVLLALALGGISWWLVEQPFRNKQHRFYVKNRVALPAACITTLAIMTIGAYGHFTHGRLALWKTHAAPESVRAFELIDAERNRSFAYDNGACVFNVNQLTAELESRMIACSKKHGAGIAIIGDSHAMNLFHVLKTEAKNVPFMVGMAQGMCRPYAPLATCNYEPLLRLVGANPELFRDIIYEQAGWELLKNAYGKDIEQDEISGLPLDAAVPNLTANRSHIEVVKTYLKKLATHSRVTWLGPRIEPEIEESVILHLGCDYPFALRPNQADVFTTLDESIRSKLKDTGVHFRSQIALMTFDMTQDFMSCDTTYWKDRNHYSAAGEERFGTRITLESVLAP